MSVKRLTGLLHNSCTLLFGSSDDLARGGPEWWLSSQQRGQTQKQSPPAQRKNRTMNKAIASGLIGLIALGGGVAIAAPSAFAQDADDLSREQRIEMRQESRAERRAETVDTLTTVLGVSDEDLQAAREAGQSVADLAAAQGVDLQTVIDALVDNAQIRIDAKIAAGDLDAERAAEISASIEDRVTARVNGERPEGRSHHGGRHGGLRGGSTLKAAPAA